MRGAKRQPSRTHRYAALAPSRGVERLFATHLWLVLLFLYLPIVVLVVLSFNDNRIVGVWTGPSLRWYRALLDEPGVLSALRNSLIVAVLSTTVATVLGTAAALSLERFRWRGQGSFDTLLFMPVIIPDITMAVMLLLLFVQIFTFMSALFGITGVFGLTTIILSHIAFNISFVAIVVRARLSGVSHVFEEAAADLYASRWQSFRHVTFPLIWPGVAGGALLSLTLSLDDVVITSFVSGPGSTTLPVYVFGMIRRGVTPLINAVSVLMLAGSMLIVIVSLAAQSWQSANRGQRATKSR